MVFLNQIARELLYLKRFWDNGKARREIVAPGFGSNRLFSLWFDCENPVELLSIGRTEGYGHPQIVKLEIGGVKRTVVCRFLLSG